MNQQNDFRLYSLHFLQRTNDLRGASKNSKNQKIIHYREEGCGFQHSVTENRGDFTKLIYVRKFRPKKILQTSEQRT